VSLISDLLHSIMHPYDAAQRRRHNEKTHQLENVIKDVQTESCRLRNTISTMVREMRGEEDRRRREEGGRGR
jgi:hypothetical protein